MNDLSNTPVCPRWLHALAVLTVLLTLVLLFLGAGVTTFGAGLVDPRGFRPPWEIVNGLLENSGLDWRLEYGHRTFGFLVGLCGIGLALGCWFFDSRPWMGWVGFLVLAMICLQGALGILRVDLHAQYPREFQLVHGIFAQLVFAVLVSVALFTSRRWTTDRSEPESASVRRWSMATMAVVFAQLVLGGLVRHQPDSLVGPRGHMLGAFVVVGAVMGLLLQLRASGSGARFRAQRVALMLLLTLQLILGVESWLAKFFVDSAVTHTSLLPVPTHSEWVRTAHYVVGAMIFSTTVMVALIAHRQSAPLAIRERPRPELALKSDASKARAELEGVA